MQDARNQFDLLTVYIGDQPIDARPYQFGENNGVPIATQYASVCYRCGQGVDFNIEEIEVKEGKLVVACKTCQDVKAPAKLIIPFVDPIKAKLLPEGWFLPPKVPEAAAPITSKPRPAPIKPTKPVELDLNDLAITSSKPKPAPSLPDDFDENEP